MSNTEAINGYLSTIAQHGNPAMDMAHWSDFVNRVQATCAENVKLREEVEVLRAWGNKDCTAMADAELERRRNNAEARAANA